VAFLRGLTSFVEHQQRRGQRAPHDAEGMATRCGEPSASPGRSEATHGGGGGPESDSEEEEDDKDTATSAPAPPPPQDDPARAAAAGLGTPPPAAPPAAATAAPVLLSLRLERLDLTDAEAGMVADWAAAAAAAGAAAVTKLWLFGNRLGDAGAREVARMLHPLMVELHLSHNQLTSAGLLCLLRAVPAGPGPCPPSPLWLRAEWNRVSLRAVAAALQAEHEGRGLIVDVPEAVRPDAAPQLPELPPYLAKAKAANDAPPPPPSRAGRNSLRFLVQRCHARLPWLSCQFEVPAEAAVLRAARDTWRGAAAPPPPSIEHAPDAASDGGVPASGPLLLIPDTSALLPMIGAAPGAAAPTFFTLRLLTSLADAGLFGRALAPADRVFIVVPSSVAVQLDALKKDPGARAAVRAFFGRGLDECGPAGRGFLTVLGAHEGEGLVLEHAAEVSPRRSGAAPPCWAACCAAARRVRAHVHLVVAAGGATRLPTRRCRCVQVAGSRGAEVGSRGQAVDHKIVEVALFFQRELMRAAGGPGAAGAGAAAAAALPVILLTGDNGQAQLARSHGLPTVRMCELAALEPAARRSLLAPGAPATAAALRALLRERAVCGLGSVAARSLQQEFDGAVACLAAAVEALAAAESRLGAVGEGEAGGGLVAALRLRLDEWQGLVVHSHQSASRVLSWTGETG
jgi:hypothetical protein